ncbi:AraC family transcriptional regulator [Caballeronia sp. SEWSISQ10-4 2]|uniref:AraC family transcriptional regulator n=1 Tax=Caballeronia sp. SEWSISQ10-4 2 TaxID=2937438 RepID=UPI00264B06F4|nr:AraC family transcriptional regulator [Caballeronia sp. SEWSISQ10-4 2]MDN7179484.1 AraC family transcriptional regulator [Caballeronia sp. SEWSISQ10-4 2]
MEGHCTDPGPINRARAGAQRQQEDQFALRRLPDFELRIYPPHKIAALVAELGEQGVPAQAALAGTGLDASQLGTPATRVSYRQLSTVMSNALRLSRDPAIALRAGQRVHVTAYGMYGYALLSSASFADAMALSGTYVPVIGPLCDTIYSRNETVATYTSEPIYWPNPASDIYRFAIEFATSLHLTVARDLAGPSFRLTRLRFVYGAPAHAHAYHQLFECPVLFGQTCNDLQYDAAWFDRPVTLADPITYAMSCETCERLLREVNEGGGIATDIRRILHSRSGQFPSLEAMAEMLSMHPRALRRKLESENTSYRDLLAEVRMRLAIEYLRKTRMTNEEIASLLGYSDAANFRHAFTRWTGKSPTTFRCC